MIDEHNQTWLFGLALVFGLLIEVVWLCKNGHRARFTEHIYATIGAVTFMIGAFGLLFKIVEFSDSVALIGIGLGLFGVIDGLAIGRRDSEKSALALDKRLARIEDAIRRGEKSS